MITFHYLKIGRPLFTLWLMEELGVDYDLKIYERNEMGRAPADLKDIHPLGKSPVIVDDGHVIAESAAIALHLVEQYDPENRFTPPGIEEKAARATFNQWFHYSEASGFAPLLVTLLLSREQDPKPPLISMFAQAEVTLQLDYINQSLGDNPYILGKRFSLPDFGLTYIISMADRLGKLEGYENLKAYMARTTARPAFQRAYAKSGE